MGKPEPIHAPWPSDPGDHLVPLSVGAATACFELAALNAHLLDAGGFARTVDLVALALSYFAPLRDARAPTHVLTPQEVQERLRGPLRHDAVRPDLDLFVVRRADLCAALKVIKGFSARFEAGC